jgi:sulfoxide reductase heme-binding subunit YedZ
VPPTLQQIRLIWKPIVFLACLAPLVWLLLHVFAIGSLRLGPNPIEEIQDTMGIWALRFIMATLAITPLRHLTGKVWLLRFRRMLGLFAFAYVALHFLNYLMLDQTFDIAGIIEDIVERPFITIGFSALLMLIPLAITSTNGWRRKLGLRWRILHRLVYVIGIFACWHFYWQVKKDISEPMIYIGILTLLLGLRLWKRYGRIRVIAKSSGSSDDEMVRQTKGPDGNLLKS